jgi:hypothetical protein
VTINSYDSRSTVIAGLGPAIHGSAGFRLSRRHTKVGQCAAIAVITIRTRSVGSVDCRAKPGNDD